MKKSPIFKGVFPPLITIFDQKGEIDWQSNKRFVDWLISKGVHGALLMGSMGEFTSLTTSERKEFVEEMIRYIDNRIPVLVGVGSTSYKETMDLTKHAENVGASGILVVNPYYWTHSEDQLVTYFSDISCKVSIPVILYNIPQMTGQLLSSELILSLATSHPNIVGVKETVNDVGHLRKVLLEVQKVREDFMVFPAFDEHILPALQIGAISSINGMSVFAPEIFVQMFEAYEAGNVQKAISLHQKCVNLMEIYEYSTPFYLGVKEAVYQRVLGKSGGARFPAVPDSALQAMVKALLKKSGLSETSDHNGMEVEEHVESRIQKT